VRNKEPTCEGIGSVEEAHKSELCARDLGEGEDEVDHAWREEGVE
jgi:hypothetical protein